MQGNNEKKKKDSINVMKVRQVGIMCSVVPFRTFCYYISIVCIVYFINIQSVYGLYTPCISYEYRVYMHYIQLPIHFDVVVKSDKKVGELRIVDAWMHRVGIV